MKTEQRSSSSETVMVGAYEFNQETTRKELAYMIILHEYLLSIVEHIGFKRFCNALQLLFEMVSQKTIKSDIMKIYESEKIKTMKLFAGIQSRIAIITDMWTSSNQNKRYMVIIAHYIDDSWTLHHRIVRFISVPVSHTVEELAKYLLDCLFDWNLDTRLSTLTVDNCTTNDAMIEKIYEKIPRKSFILDGALFHMRCCVHILNLIVKDGLQIISTAIENIRDSVQYWTASPKRKKKFEDTCRLEGVSINKKLVIDCKTRWNSTFFMLAAAIPCKDVFSRLQLCEPQYKCLLSEDDWEMVKEICDKLEFFHSVTELFSGTKYPTLNIYFPKVCEIRLALKEWLTCSHYIVREMAENMMTKFDKYWDEINGVMAVGTVLDPRYKMLLVNYFFGLIYGENAPKEIKRVTTICQDLVEEYEENNKSKSRSSSTSSSVVTSLGTKAGSWKRKFALFVQENKANVSAKSELDIYLAEQVLRDVFEDKFDILAWWKTNGLQYPTLQRIARNLLTIPISTVASESSFSTGDRVLSTHCSKLHPNIVQFKP